VNAGSATSKRYSLHETYFTMREFLAALCHPSLPRLDHQNDTRPSG
jgi:hypothetical protein